jgi:hypothetical protein
MEKIRVITTKTDVPEGTVSHKGFHLLNMGDQGTWLVDQDHPGYPGCVKKALQLAIKEHDSVRINKYGGLPKGTYTKPTAFNTTRQQGYDVKLAPEAKEIDKIDKK